MYTCGSESLAVPSLLGGRLGCAVQIHAESGPCADVPEMAVRAGMPPDRVDKH